MGIRVGLGVDGSASNDGSNLLEEIRVCYLLHRLNSSRKVPSGYNILKIATRGSASILGRNDIGSIEVGKCGDLFMIDSNKFELVGAFRNPKSIFGIIGYKKTVDYTIVNGKIVVEKGRMKNIDEDIISEKANTEVKRLLYMS